MASSENALHAHYSIKIADADDLTFIQEIAEKTWPVAYAEILSPEQMRYMLDKMYAIEALKKQLAAGHFFLLAASDKETIGFASYELNYENSNSTKLHKLYVLPQMQEKNAGIFLLNEVINSAKAANQKSILLNVNRNNNAVSFYKRHNFSILKTEDIDIGNGFFMNDFVMELKL